MYFILSVLCVVRIRHFNILSFCLTDLQCSSSILTLQKQISRFQLRQKILFRILKCLNLLYHRNPDFSPNPFLTLICCIVPDSPKAKVNEGQLWPMAERPEREKQRGSEMFIMLLRLFQLTSQHAVAQYESVTAGFKFHFLCNLSIKLSTPCP